jgi:hypothetical protein
VVVVYQSLHQNLLVSPAGPDLQPLQLQQLLEYPPLQVVPAETNISRRYHFLLTKPTKDNIHIPTVLVYLLF